MSGAPDESGAFFGRRKGKALRPGQGDLVATLLPRLRLPADGAIDPAALFPGPVSGLTLEIGFGGGEHLAARARENPGRGYIGCEPFINGMAKMLGAVERERLSNVRLWDEDAAALLPRIAPASLDEIYLLYADPWPKRRQRKRRFVSPATVEGFARLLKPGGRFRFASDIDDYVGWTLARVLPNPAFRWTAARADDWRLPYPGWPGTRYEAKALREGRRPSYLTFERV
ncbi:tRNA (guanine(46)-N(7))-methyltransferase TrmB [Salinarimonas soli]|uniref:tRNA (guanine(46)-N(7))-methyltransferase TrmB n=1 Tax=Salinarimonas soli TaxID=1638099 RepID=UPI001F0AE327|nr:tRNA (guanine(46)-N(7))-methyltransferase TrmB [Salinarimonas soli]